MACHRYLGTNPLPTLQFDPTDYDSSETVRFSLDPSSSALYAALCGAAGASASCNFKSRVFLGETLECFGAECLLDAPRVVRLNATIGDKSASIYFEYVRPACVGLSYYTNATLITKRGGKSWTSRPYCADPAAPLAGAACCSHLELTQVEKVATPFCEFWGERMRLNTAVERCADFGGVCSFDYVLDGEACDSTYSHYWTNQPCALLAEISTDGTVTIAHGASAGASTSEFPVGAGVPVRVNWGNDTTFPSVADGTCGQLDACYEDASASTCICNMTVTDTPVFTGATVPSAAVIASQLTVGAFDPAMFPEGTFFRCTSSACTSSADVSVYCAGTCGGGDSGSVVLDVGTVFEVLGRGGSSTFYKNVLSTVEVAGMHGGRVYSFRNPPAFMTPSEPTVGVSSVFASFLGQKNVWHGTP